MLTINRVTKRFDGVVAVDDLSFTVTEGRIVGFLGPNGSGKTTTMRMVLDILRPDSGRILWRDAPIDERVRRRFGYLPEERGLYQKMRVGEQLLFFARLFGMERPRAEQAIAGWLERLGLADRARSRIQELSKGNQQKVQVIAALLHEPDLALLDEPFSGLDPVNTELLVDALVELRDAGKTVVFSSHRLEQVEELCQDVAIIAQGHLRLAGDVDELRERGMRRVVLVRTVSRDALDVTGLPLLPLAPGRDHLRFALEEGADPQAVLAMLADRERIELFALERPSLQEIFLEVTGEEAARSAVGDEAATAGGAAFGGAAAEGGADARNAPAGEGVPR